MSEKIINDGAEAVSDSFLDYLSLMVSKLCVRLHNLKISLRFPSVCFNMIIDCINPIPLSVKVEKKFSLLTSF